MIANAPWRDTTVRAGPLVNIPNLLHEFRCNPDSVLRLAGLNPDVLNHPEDRISYLAVSRLLARCVEATGCDHFGLLLGQRNTPSHLGLAGFLMRAAPTVRRALESLIENLDLNDEGGIATLDETGGYCRLSYQIVQPGVAAVDQVYDLSAVHMCKIMRVLCGKRWTASEVLLPRRRPKNPAPYSGYFRTTIFFDSDTCSVLFPSHQLDSEPPSGDQLLFEHLKEEADMLHHTRHAETVDTLPAVLQRGLLLNRFSARDIAGAIGLHERTLHRRLQCAGTSFRVELDRVRESLSTQLLEGTTLPVSDIATSLGYADSSGFIRAFRRWTGFSPTGWRRHKPYH